MIIANVNFLYDDIVHALKIQLSWRQTPHDRPGIIHGKLCVCGAQRRQRVYNNVGPNIYLLV